MSPCQSPRRQSKSRSPKLAAYWDNLSTIWLTKGALQELQRRIGITHPLSQSPTPAHTPARRRYSRTATALLQQCPPRCRREIKRLSRQGGPDLSDLRGCPPPRASSSAAMPTTRSRINRMTESRRTGQTSSPSPSSSHNDTSTTTTPYSQNLEQNLIDHQIYPPLYQGQDNSDDENEPNNIGEIRRRLAATRPSLDPSTFSKAEYHQFRKANWAAKKEADVTASVFPFIEGTNGTTSSSRQQYVSRDTRFTNLAPLTDGTISQAKPDISYGARPEQLDREIRNQLSDRVIPSANDRLSLAPNFRVEVKGPGGAPRVAVRQACYYGALGVRAMDALQSYEPARDQQGSQQQSLGPELRSVSDNNAYAVTATYSSGILNLYTSHSTMSTTTPNQDVSQRRPEYIMTPLRSFALINGVESFCAGAAAYRNARDWTGEVRDGAIARANGRLTEARASRARGRGGEPGLDSVIEQEEEGEAEGEEVDPFSGTRLN